MATWTPALERRRRRPHGQGDREGIRAAHGRRPAAALPAPAGRARRAHRSRRAARSTTTSRSWPRCAGAEGRRLRQDRAAVDRRRRRPGRARSAVLRPAQRLARRERAGGALGLFAGKVGDVQPAPPARPPRVPAARATTRWPIAEADVYARADPGLPRDQGRPDLDDRQRGQAGPRHARPARRTRVPPTIRPGRSCRPSTRAMRAMHAPDDWRGSGRRRKQPAELGRGVRAPARARPAPAWPRPSNPATPRPARPGGLLDDVRRAAAVRAHRRPARGRRDARGRARRVAPDAPPAAGRGRLGQDGRRAAGDAAGRRRRRTGRAARADRGARRAARPHDRGHARAAGAGRAAGRRRRRHAGRAAHRLAAGRRAAARAARRRERRGRHRRRHPRADPGARPVRRPRPGRGGRAAPLRRRAARRPARQGGRNRRTCW